MSQNSLRFWLCVFGVLVALGGCLPSQKTSESDEQTLTATYGRKKLYLWNKSFQSKNDKIWRSCWYYKEAPPSLGLSERQALMTSVRLNDYAIHDGHVQKQLERILREKLINIGAEFVPCGLATVSVGAAIASGGGIGCCVWCELCMDGKQLH